jgi:RNA methyltransferase, TrmH family
MAGEGDGEENEATRAARQWRTQASDAVLLDGFHALKHALRFGADVRTVLACDKSAVLALAAELAADVAPEIDALAVEVPARVLRELVLRVHPTGIAALAGRPSRDSNSAPWPSSPVVHPPSSWTDRATSETSVPSSASPRGWEPPV